MAATAEQIKALPLGSVITLDTEDEGVVPFLKGVVFSGESAEEAEEVNVWLAPNAMTFDEVAFSGEDAPLDNLNIVYVGEVK